MKMISNSALLFGRRLSIRTRQRVGYAILAPVLTVILVAVANRYREAEAGAYNYRIYQSQQIELTRRLNTAKYGDRAQGISGVMNCLERAKDESCLPELKKLQDLIKTIPGADHGEFDWWYVATLWQSSNGAVNAANNDRLVKRAALYGYINNSQPYLHPNDPTRKKFHEALRQRLIAIDLAEQH